MQHGQKIKKRKEKRRSWCLYLFKTLSDNLGSMLAFLIQFPGLQTILIFFWNRECGISCALRVLIPFRRDHIKDQYWVFLGLHEEMATHSSILAWKIHGLGSLSGYRLLPVPVLPVQVLPWWRKVLLLFLGDGHWLVFQFNASSAFFMRFSWSLRLCSMFMNSTSQKRHSIGLEFCRATRPPGTCYLKENVKSHVWNRKSVCVCSVTSVLPGSPVAPWTGACQAPLPLLYLLHWQVGSLPLHHLGSPLANVCILSIVYLFHHLVVIWIYFFFNPGHLQCKETSVDTLITISKY